MSPTRSNAGPNSGEGDAARLRGGPTSPAGDRLQPAPEVPGPADVPTVNSSELLRGRSAVHILHNGETYRLTVTRSGKLILQK
ncbi:MAG: hemin uptake protein HemP [Pirellulales bacterium]